MPYQLDVPNQPEHWTSLASMLGSLRNKVTPVGLVDASLCIWLHTKSELPNEIDVLPCLCITALNCCSYQNSLQSRPIWWQIFSILYVRVSSQLDKPVPASCTTDPAWPVAWMIACHYLKVFICMQYLANPQGTEHAMDPLKHLGERPQRQITRFCIYGERCSGTNWCETTIIKLQCHALPLTIWMHLASKHLI